VFRVSRRKRRRLREESRWRLQSAKHYAQFQGPDLMLCKCILKRFRLHISNYGRYCTHGNYNSCSPAERLESSCLVIPLLAHGNCFADRFSRLHFRCSTIISVVPRSRYYRIGQTVRGHRNHHDRFRLHNPSGLRFKSLCERTLETAFKLKKKNLYNC
jgi:hypothetical protein